MLLHITKYLKGYLLFKDEPLAPEDDVERQLRAKKLQTAEDDTAEIEAASFKKFSVEANSLARVKM